MGVGTLGQPCNAFRYNGKAKDAGTCTSASSFHLKTLRKLNYAWKVLAISPERLIARAESRQQGSATVLSSVSIPFYHVLSVRV